MAEGIKGSKNVIVLTDNFKPSQSQWNLLNRGLTFVPTINLYKNQRKQIQLDIQNYHRRVKLATYFHSRDNKRKPPVFMPTSLWSPPLDKLPPEVNTLIRRDHKDFDKHFRTQKEYPNLSWEEEIALKELVQNKNIVIKPADKGSSIVILGRDQYIAEVNRQLNDKMYYKRLDKPIYLDTVPIVHDILNTLCKNKFINKKQLRYLKGELEPRPRRFYILPKIHKEPEKWTIPFKVPPGRPIVADCGSETYQTAEFIDYFLNPLSVKHSSYLKDTYHFISIIKDLDIPTDSFFFTIDIDSLYTNIDTEAGLKAVKKLFNRYPARKRPDKEILQLLEINLTRNDFEFNGNFYLQIKGTAMGKRFAPAYANIFMADWEENALSKCSKKPFIYLRYLDDIFGIWTHSVEEFRQFIHILDTFDPSIRLKYNFHIQSINFLDTTVYKGRDFLQNHKLDIKVYFKETDTHALLFKTSFHPVHTYRGLIKSQLIRFSRICSQKEDFEEAVGILFSALRKRGYSRSFLRQCRDRFLIPSSKQGEETQLIPLIINYSSAGAVLNRKIKDNFTNMITTQGLLKNYQVISAYRRNKNLRDYLVRARLQPMQSSKKKRTFSENFSQLEYVRNRIKKSIFKIPQGFNLDTRNCVYIIICQKCGMQYIGETKNSISTRMNQHKYNIKHKKDIHTPLVKHFIEHGWRNLKISGIQSNSFWSDQDRKAKERHWIYLMDTKEPFGLNIKFG